MVADFLLSKDFYLLIKVAFLLCRENNAITEASSSWCLQWCVKKRRLLCLLQFSLPHIDMQREFLFFLVSALWKPHSFLSITTNLLVFNWRVYCNCSNGHRIPILLSLFSCPPPPRCTLLGDVVGKKKQRYCKKKILLLLSEFLQSSSPSGPNSRLCNIFFHIHAPPCCCCSLEGHAGHAPLFCSTHLDCKPAISSPEKRRDVTHFVLGWPPVSTSISLTWMYILNGFTGVKWFATTVF